MAILRIPPEVVKGLKDIALLNEEQFQELLSAFKSIPLKIRQHRIFDSEFKLTTVSVKEASRIHEALFSLYMSRVGTDVSVSTYANDIVQSLKEEKLKDKDWAPSEETFDRLRERLIRLLSIGTLDKVAKAHDVLLEHAQTFGKARIVSDIRLVFGDEIEKTPIGAVIVHMLNIGFSRSGKREEFFVALDTKDIQLLMDVLERAKLKAEKLKSVIASANLEYIEVV